VQLTYLLKGLELTPAIAERLVPAVPEANYDEKRDPERFSFREVVAHLADWEEINQERFRKTVEEPGCTVFGLDPDERAIEKGYASADPVAEVKRFAERRKETLAYLAARSEEDWAKISIHSERGRQTLYELATSILGHDVGHLDQISQYM